MVRVPPRRLRNVTGREQIKGPGGRRKRPSFSAHVTRGRTQDATRPSRRRLMSEVAHNYGCSTATVNAGKDPSVKCEFQASTRVQPVPSGAPVGQKRALVGHFWRKPLDPVARDTHRQAPIRAAPRYGQGSGGCPRLRPDTCGSTKERPIGQAHPRERPWRQVARSGPLRPRPLKARIRATRSIFTPPWSQYDCPRSSWRSRANRHFHHNPHGMAISRIATEQCILLGSAWFSRSSPNQSPVAADERRNIRAGHEIRPRAHATETAARQFSQAGRIGNGLRRRSRHGVSNVNDHTATRTDQMREDLRSSWPSRYGQRALASEKKLKEIALVITKQSN